MVNLSLKRLEGKSKNGPHGWLTPEPDDAQLFGAYRDLIERGGGDDVFSASLDADGEEVLARAVRALVACRTASEFMALEP